MIFIKHSDHSEQADQDLLLAYRRHGDLAVLGKWFQQYMDLIYAVCLKYLKSPDASKDAVMQIFEELVVKLRHHEVSYPKSWLHTVARNHCLMQLRTPKNLKTVSFEGDFMQWEENGHLQVAEKKEEQLQSMEQCLDTLPPEQKQAVELFYLQEKSYKEIAALTGVDWNKIRSHIQNGRRNLKICMEKKQAATAASK